MLYLVLSIFSSAMISVVMRLSQGRTTARISLLAANYLTCTICASFFLNTGTQLAGHTGMGFTLSIGVLNGFIYVGSLILSQLNIRKNGVVLSSVFSKIGDLLVPFAVSVLFFAERPVLVQLLGAVIAIGAIVAMNYEKKTEKNNAMVWLLLLFAIDGMTGTTSKIYEEAGQKDLAPLFLLLTFATALVLCTTILVAKKERPGLSELLFGIMIGIPNFFSSRFLLLALGSIPAVVAYPLRSVGSIMVVTFTGLFFFHEKLRKMQWAAVCAIVAAVILLSIP